MPRRTSEPTSGSFEAAWPSVETRLRRVLSRAGAPSWIADDVIQETAIRVLRKWEELDKTKPLLPWAVTVARNLLVDHHRAAARFVDEPGDDAVTADAEEIALARLELDKVRRALERLHPRYRAALLAVIGEAPEIQATRFARNTARMRARRQLAAILQSMRGVVVTTAASFRRLRRSLYLGLSKNRNLAGMEAFVQGATSLVIVATVLLATNSALAAREGVHTPAYGSQMLTSARGAHDSMRTPITTTSETAGSVADPSDQPGPTSDAPDHAVAAIASLPPYGGATGAGMGFGPGGYDLRNSGSTWTGPPVSWKQRHTFDTPDCIDDVLASQAPGPCDTKGAHGYVKVEAAGQKHRVDY